jgi:hypothetical protein
MCLTIKKDQKSQFSKEGIPCYKVLRALGIDNYQTFYRFTHVELNQVYKSKLTINKGLAHDFVEIGLHTYADQEECIADTLSDFSRSSWIIIKCFIPKKTKFYTGEFSKYKSYASTTLIITDEIVYSNFKDN